MFTEGFIQKVGLKGPYPVGGEGGNFQKKTPAHPEILIVERIALGLLVSKSWIAASEAQK